MARKAGNNQTTQQSQPAASNPPANAQPPGAAPEQRTNLDNCLKGLAGVQDQIRFADTKAAFVFAINTLLFGFVANSVGTIKQAFTLNPVPTPAWVGMVALILFGICSVIAVGLLIFTVMSRLGAFAPKSRAFFGHIATTYGKDYAKYVDEVKAMKEEDWLNEVGTQIVEISHIALAKHSTVRYAAMITIGGLVCWVVAVFSISLIP